MVKEVEEVHFPFVLWYLIVKYVTYFRGHRVLVEEVVVLELHLRRLKDAFQELLLCPAEVEVLGEVLMWVAEC